MARVVLDSDDEGTSDAMLDLSTAMVEAQYAADLGDARISLVGLDPKSQLYSTGSTGEHPACMHSMIMSDILPERLRREIDSAHHALVNATPSTSRKRRASFSVGTPKPPSTFRQKNKRVKTVGHIPEPSEERGNNFGRPTSSRAHGRSPKVQEADNRSTSRGTASSDIWIVPLSSLDVTSAEHVSGELSLESSNRALAVAAGAIEHVEPAHAALDGHSGSTEIWTPIAPPPESCQFTICIPPLSSTVVNTSSAICITAQTTHDDGEMLDDMLEQPQPSLEFALPNRSSSPVYFANSASQQNLHNHIQPQTSSATKDQEGSAMGPGHQITHSTPPGSEQGTQKKPANKDTIPELTLSDEVAIGLPREQYQPRPSRWRAKGAVQESTEAPLIETKKPRKQRTRRHQTTLPDIAADMKTLNKLGYRGQQAEQALVDAGGHVETAVAKLFAAKMANTDQEEGCAANAPSKDDDAKMMVAGDVIVATTAQTQLRDSKKKSRRSRKDPNAAGKTSIELGDAPVDQPVIQMPDSETCANDENESIVVDASKKGREYGKKSLEAVVATVIDHDVPVRQIADPVLQETDSNPRTRFTTAPADDAEPLDPPEAPINLDEVAKTPPKSAAGKVSKKQHSPINKSSVAFKVGLSRRARVESLLRVIKK